MKLELFFAAIALIHAMLLLWTLRTRADTAEWLVRTLLLALMYDNIVLAFGTREFDQAWYYSASWLRYGMHVLVLPPLVIAALQLANRSGVLWANRRLVIMASLLFVAAGLAIGIVTELLGLELVRETLFGHVRFVSADSMPPIATILTNIVVLIIAACIWRIAAWPWLFLGALTIFLVNGVSAGMPWSIVSGNLAEVLFAAGWVLTLQRFKPVAD
ncbi:MAG: hypothetical protein K0U72_12750 [Gammaproteobacteria bacterium]|nr:hypothetical protein [Gammaproteobacteria bacterium]